MIRGFSLFAMIRIMKMKDVELYNSSVSKLDTKKVLCPCCKQNMKRHGSYDRELVVFDDEVKCEQISIVRFRCEECNITHGFFTENIVPYSNFSLFFILKVLNVYFNKEKTVISICEEYDISVSELYKWVHLFEKMKNIWLMAIKKIYSRQKCEAEDCMEYIIFFDRYFMSNFYQMFDFSFMQNIAV